MTTSLHSRSSWISSLLYKRCPDGKSYLALILKTEPDQEPKALLYGPDLPSWVPGLVAAGTPKGSGDEHYHSPGRAYHKLVKGKYQGQKVEGKEAVERLKEIMK
jgi:hypothetical protein